MLSCNVLFSQYPDNTLTFAYLTLAEIGSFKGDINLAHHIALNSGRTRHTNTQGLINTIPITHCIDHHTNTGIVHYLNYPLTYGTYPESLNQVWIQVSGVNPRKLEYAEWYPVMEEQPYVQEVRNAQVYVWTSRSYTPQPRPVLDKDPFVFSYVLDRSWLAGMIGPIEVKIGHITAVVVLDVSDITKVIAIKKPSRDKTQNPILTDEETDIALSAAKNILREGKILKNIPTTLPVFKGVTVALVEDTYLLFMSGQWVSWDQARVLQYSLLYHPSLGEYQIMQSLTYTGDGIDERLNIHDIFTTYNLNVLKRLSTYLTGHRSKIELHRVSRDGTGTYYQVKPEDTGVNQVLSFICVVYPAALVKRKNVFIVKNGPLLWMLTDVINAKISELTVSDPHDQGWLIPAEETRIRWNHQQTALDQMITRHEQGKKGHLIWIPVGMGKTLIVIDYIDYLIKNRQMPDYCVYSLPSSAIDNIIKEFEYRQIPVKVLDARMNSSLESKTINPFVINLIKHDHMRLGGMDKKMKEIAGEMLFIVDEFHKTLSKTIRTSIAVELVSLSHDFIGLSGTIIKDTHHDELIKWLERIVEFEVTKDNYWVAVGAMVSRRVYTKVIVDRQDIPVEMTQEQKDEYYSMVPSNLGGTSRDINFNEVVNFCYQVVTPEMVRYIIHFLNQGEQGVFVVAKSIKHQEQIRDLLLNLGIGNQEVHLFGKDSQVTLTPDYVGPIRIVITTPRHSEGYTLTKFRVMIQSVYFTNQATREQLEGRVNRIGQVSDVVYVFTLHTGILSNVLERYEKVRSLSEALKGFAKEVGFTI